LLLMATFAIAQSEKTIISSFRPQGNEILVNFSCPSETEVWEKDYVRVSLEITANISEHLLKFLLKEGRYHLDVKVSEETIISLPNINNDIIFEDEVIRESFKLHLFVPYGVQVKQNL
jgi:hypothetical protein